MKEIWLPIKGYEGIYEVSNLGRVKSLSRANIMKNNVNRPIKEKVLTSIKDFHGYCHVNIFRNKKSTTTKIHRMVAMAFIPNPENKPHINHKNGVKHDNRVENLEWCTPSENQIHSYKVLGKAESLKGRINPKGKENGRSKKIIATNIDTGEEINIYGVREAARLLSMYAANVSKVLHGKKYSTGGYNFRFADNIRGYFE